MMKTKFMMFGLCASIAAAANAQPVSNSSSASSVPSDKWVFSITPYLWALGVSGSVSHDETTLGSVRLNPGNVLSNVHMAGMVTGEARLNRVGLFVDAMYGDLGKVNSRTEHRVNRALDTHVKVGLLTVAPFYTLVQTDAWRLNGLVGVRFMWQNVSSTYTVSSKIGRNQLTKSIAGSGTVQVTDAVVGLKGRVKLGQSDFFIPYYVDVGVGDKSSFTSQAYAGIGRTFEWGDISLVAKNVYYRFTPNRLTTELNMFGLAVGATFRF